MLHFGRGRHTGISSAAARNSRRHRLATRAVFAQRTPQRHAHRMAFRVLSRTRTHLPDPHEKTPSFLSFPPMVLSAHPVSRFQHRLLRARTRTRSHYARLSQFQKNAFTSSPTSCISLLYSELWVKTLAFFPSPLSSRDFTPKVKNFRRGDSHKNGPKWRRIGEAPNGEGEGEGKKQKPSPLNSSRSTFCNRSVKR